MITRKDYMNRDHPATHSDYYRDVIQAAGLRPSFDAEFLAVLREEFEGGNVHFNSLDSDVVNRANQGKLRLQAWDCRSHVTNTSATHAALKARGDWLTQSGMTCLIKELARIAIEESENECA